MHEILRQTQPGDRVLDLGAQFGSFAASDAAGLVVRLDLDPRPGKGGLLVCGRAEALPFRDNSFRAVVSNHSLEHFDQLDEALVEASRTLAPGGALYAAVPDSATLSDRLYRWLGRGGGHVNPFPSLVGFHRRVSEKTGLPYRGGRELFASWSFLNRKNSPGRVQKKLYLLGGGGEWTLRWWSRLARQLDALLGTRIAAYGWACYFGEASEVDAEAWSNVCIRCGAGRPAGALAARSQGWICSSYRCPSCSAVNLFTSD